MAMTAQVKAELASTKVTKSCCRKSEVSSMLRFAGGLHIVSGRIVVEAELDTGAAARRLRKDIAEIYGHTSDVVMVSDRYQFLYRMGEFPAARLRQGSAHVAEIKGDMARRDIGVSVRVAAVQGGGEHVGRSLAADREDQEPRQPGQREQGHVGAVEQTVVIEAASEQLRNLDRDAGPDAE